MQHQEEQQCDYMQYLARHSCTSAWLGNKPKVGFGMGSCSPAGRAQSCLLSGRKHPPRPAMVGQGGKALFTTTARLGQVAAACAHESPCRLKSMPGMRRALGSHLICCLHSHVVADVAGVVDGRAEDEIAQPLEHQPCGDGLLARVQHPAHELNGTIEGNVRFASVGSSSSARVSWSSAHANTHNHRAWPFKYLVALVVPHGHLVVHAERTFHILQGKGSGHVRLNQSDEEATGWGQQAGTQKASRY